VREPERLRKGRRAASARKNLNSASYGQLSVLRLPVPHPFLAFATFATCWPSWEASSAR
jgi:hypothetical protein